MTGWPLVAASALGLIMSLVEYFNPDDGINGTLGVLIVIGSTALMLIASAAIALWLDRGRLRMTLMVLILLDILGTGFAAYMLDAYILLGFMVLALIAWLFAIFAAGRSRAPVTAEATP
jgi:hypothetical protein